MAPVGTNDPPVEGRGFEPSVPRERDNAFRASPSDLAFPMRERDRGFESRSLRRSTCLTSEFHGCSRSASQNPSNLRQYLCGAIFQCSDRRQFWSTFTLSRRYRMSTLDEITKEK